MWRILIRNKLRRNHRLFLYFTGFIVFCVFIHSNLNQYQMVNITTNEKDYNILLENLIEPVNLTTLQERTESLTTTVEALENQETTSTAQPTNTTIVINATKAPVTRTQPTRLGWIGHVHSYLWRSMCTINVRNLLEHPLFPLWPSIKGQPEMPDELESVMSKFWSAQRVFGLLYPPVSGYYRFKIYSDTIAEFWLSLSEEPRNSKLLARNNKNIIYSIEFEKGPLIQTSKKVYLKHGQAYFFDIIHGFNSAGVGTVRVRWMMPKAKVYTGIPKTSVSTILENDNSIDSKYRKFLLSSASLVHKEPILKKLKSYQWQDQEFSKPFQPYMSYTR